jgi:hypothetical protein
MCSTLIDVANDRNRLCDKLHSSRVTEIGQEWPLDVLLFHIAVSIQLWLIVAVFDS